MKPPSPWQQAAFQQLSFNVWHALAAHRPLGGINRVRRLAYPLSAAWRRQQASAVAPAADEIPR